MASAPLKWVLKVANGLHVALYRMSDGKFANKIANLPILLITTFGLVPLHQTIVLKKTNQVEQEEW